MDGHVTVPFLERSDVARTSWWNVETMAAPFYRLMSRCSRLSRRTLSLALLHSRKRRWQRVALGLGATLAAIPISQSQSASTSLAHEDLIKRAVSLVTDGANTFLSQTTLALIDALTEYTKAVHTLVSLQQQYSGLVGHISEKEEDAIWQVIIEARVKSNMYREKYLSFESKWLTAIKVSEMAAEAAYQAGADSASVTAHTHIQMAQTQVAEIKQLALKAEAKLAQVQVEEIHLKRTEEAAVKASKEIANLSAKDDEIPEQYLRED
ncbi:diablo IAP-binding mitochondrial protein-like isoform X1 [Hemiscyllium ocellatum]|uniref:diablo IAP-binding mitochondrial protein-like isoform X1 n=1 Tax=Hemiscyllium ocellatum TaxID=170820 RepID=UPI002965ED8C|nr:diablo IAP-binding mitochondrial protein-like isoform X1 [Hemiscyllium ocellatum]